MEDSYISNIQDDDQILDSEMIENMHKMETENENLKNQLSESEQNQFKQEFSNSQPAQPDTPAPQPEQPAPQPEQPSQPQPEPPSPQPEQPSPQPEQPSQPEPQTWTKTQIAGEDFDGKSLSKKQMAVMELGMAMGNSYPPEIMAVYNAQKGKK